MYVVTGTTGNTGSEVTSQLLAAGKQVRGIGRSAERLQHLAHKGCEPFVADLLDRDVLAKAFHGAEAAYLMIPPDYSAPDVRAHQQSVIDAMAGALENSSIKHAVVLSSIGADKPQGTGPVVGLHLLEERLKQISGLNTLFLRAAYFMENTFVQADMIHKLGKAVGALDPELRLPMIATRDIGAAAAQALLDLNFKGHQTRELQGSADLTMKEVASIIGKAIGKPELKYVQAPEEQIRSAMLQMGMSEDLVAQLLEMSASLNSGYMKALEPRSAANTTPTSFVAFVREEFAPLYKGKAAA
jgi:uncharacterized protein YbjT (DUF2867 family)